MDRLSTSVQSSHSVVDHDGGNDSSRRTSSSDVVQEVLAEPMMDLHSSATELSSDQSRLISDRSTLESGLKKQFMDAVAKGDCIAVKESLEKAGTQKNALLHCKDNDGQTAVHIAVINGKADALKLLIEAGYDLSTKDHKYGYTPLRLLASGSVKNDEKICEEILNAIDKKNALPEMLMEDQSGGSVLWVLSHNEEINEVLIQKLISHLCYLPQETLRPMNDGQELLNALSDVGKPVPEDMNRLVNKLSNTSIPVDGSDLAKAARFGNIQKVIDFLSENKTLLKFQDESGRTAVHYAMREGHIDILEHLLSNGYDLSVKDKRGATVLFYCCDVRDPKISLEALHLIKKKVGEDDQLYSFLLRQPIGYLGDNHTCLLRGKYEEVLAWNYVLCDRGQLDIFRKIAKKHAMVDVKKYGKIIRFGSGKNPEAATVDFFHNEYDIKNMPKETELDMTPLHAAIFRNNVETAIELIYKMHDLSLNLSMPDKFGLTPLHYAAMRGQQGVVNALVTMNANCDGKDNEGRTPKKIAELNGHTNLRIEESELST